MKQVLQGVFQEKLEFSEKAGGGFEGFKGEVDKSPTVLVTTKSNGKRMAPLGYLRASVHVVSSDRITQSARTSGRRIFGKKQGNAGITA